MVCGEAEERDMRVWKSSPARTFGGWLCSSCLLHFFKNAFRTVVNRARACYATVAVFTYTCPLHHRADEKQILAH